jgi:hypothetical protein
MWAGGDLNLKRKIKKRFTMKALIIKLDLHGLLHNAFTSNWM